MIKRGQQLELTLGAVDREGRAEAEAKQQPGNQQKKIKSAKKHSERRRLGSG
jgi:hypothetical protein